MEIKKLMRLLRTYNIKYKIHEGMIFAEDVWVVDGKVHSTYINVTNYTATDMFEWLGY